MAKFRNSEGLYTKSNSILNESVTQSEGLYKKQRTASVTIDNPSDVEIDDLNKMKEHSKQQVSKRMLKE